MRRYLTVMILVVPIWMQELISAQGQIINSQLTDVPSMSLNTSAGVSGSITCTHQASTTIKTFIPGMKYVPGYSHLSTLVEGHLLLCNTTGTDDTHVALCLGTGNCSPYFTVKANSCFNDMEYASDSATSPTSSLDYSMIVKIDSPDTQDLTAWGANPLAQEWIMEQPF